MANNGRNGNYISLYSTRAHVFQINPETRNSWLPKGEAVPISFVASIQNSGSTIEPNKRELKIIGTGDNGETVLDATILHETSFTKRSQKFGQWIDPTNTVYGLGFNSEKELNEFVETFKQLQQNILSPLSLPQQQQGLVKRQQQLQQQRPLSNNGMHPTNGDTRLTNNGNNSNSENIEGFPRSQSMFGLQSTKANSVANNLSGALTPENGNSPLSQTEWPLRDQLKYENERMKQALEESSKTANLWHNELLALRTNNAKLTQALQESRGNVVKWEHELLSLRDENVELKKRISALESANDSEQGNECGRDLQKYKNYVDEVQDELRRRENEIEELQRKMGDLEMKASEQNGKLTDAQFALEPKHRHKIEVISAKLEAKISELVGIQKEFSQLVDQLE